MSRQSAVHVLAGSLNLLGLALGHWVSPWWLLLSAFVGVNLLQSGLTGFCLSETIFAKLGLKDGSCQSRVDANG
ncbi:MAG: DUF2892 domain-containing protein [Tepidisphaeraceae bacterium]|jgi:hypothetical protein